MHTLASALSWRPRKPVPFISCLLAAMAALAAVLAVCGISGVFGSPALAATITSGYPSQDLAAADLYVKQLAAAHLTTVAKTAVAIPLYTVRAGDSISSIAQKTCGTPADWTGIYAASRKLRLTAWNANDLVAGQHLAIQCYQNPGMAGRAPLPPPVPVPAAQTVQAVSYSAPVQHAYQAPATTVSTSGDGSYQACVIARESGGNSQVMNASGHYGLYQFDYGTWVSGGGSGADFGHASVAEQNQVFAAVYAARGTQPWSPSDGC